jgi:hypothetical protein
MPYTINSGVSLATVQSLDCDVKQVETATAVGTISQTGNATVVITAAGATLATVSVAVTNGNVAATWAGKVRTALNATAAITALYTVGGSSATISLTRIIATLNDPTLNISLDNGTCLGITTAATSANTTPGLPVASDASPVMDGSVAEGTGLTYSRADHVHPTDTSRLASTQNLPGINRTIKVPIFIPNALGVTTGTVIPLMITDGAITITKLEARTSSASYEIAGDLKWADARIGLGNAAVIETFDTTSGVRTDTAIAAGAVASGKLVYLQWDSAPDAAMTDCFFQITFDYD